MDPMELLLLVRKQIEWVSNYENKNRSIACNQQSLRELQKKRQRALEYIEYHTQVLHETDTKIEAKLLSIRNNTAFCSLHQQQYVSWKNTIDSNLINMLEKAEKTAERVNQDERGTSTAGPAEVH